MAVVVLFVVPVVVSTSFVVQSLMHRFSKYDWLVLILFCFQGSSSTSWRTVTSSTASSRSTSTEPRRPAATWCRRLAAREDGFFDVVWEASCHREQHMAVFVSVGVPVVVINSLVVRSLMHQFNKYDWFVIVLLVRKPGHMSEAARVVLTARKKAGVACCGGARG